MRAMAKGGQSKGAGRMDVAWRLYEAGDKVAARREAEKILADNPSEAEQAAARELIARSGFPREGLYLAGLAAVMIILFILLGIARS